MMAGRPEDKHIRAKKTKTDNKNGQATFDSQPSHEFTEMEIVWEINLIVSVTKPLFSGCIYTHVTCFNPSKYK